MAGKKEIRKYSQDIFEQDVESEIDTRLRVAIKTAGISKEHRKQLLTLHESFI